MLVVAYYQFLYFLNFSVLKSLYSSQVTRQTQHLTMAFEKQSQHISGLLAELQDRESALLSQGEELQRYKQERHTFKAQIEGEEKRREEMTVKDVEDVEQKEEAQEEKSVEILELLSNQEKESSVTLNVANSLADSESNAQRDAVQPEIVTSDAERQPPGSVDSDRTQRNHDVGEIEYGPGRSTTDMAAELLAFRQENQLLKQRILGLNISKTSTPLINTENEHKEDPVKRSQNTEHAALPCLTEPRSSSEPCDITAKARQSPLQNVGSAEEKVGGLVKEDRSTKEELEAMSQPQINRLQLQVTIVYYLFI